MDEAFVCECGNKKFWFFWGFVRCTNCWNEYKKTLLPTEGEIVEEQWLRRFNLEKKEYDPNWERSKITYKNKK